MPMSKVVLVVQESPGTGSIDEMVKRLAAAEQIGVPLTVKHGSVYLFDVLNGSKALWLYMEKHGITKAWKIGVFEIAGAACCSNHDEWTAWLRGRQ